MIIWTWPKVQVIIWTFGHEPRGHHLSLAKVSFFTPVLSPWPKEPSPEPGQTCLWTQPDDHLDLTKGPGDHLDLWT